MTTTIFLKFTDFITNNTLSIIDNMIYLFIYLFILNIISIRLLSNIMLMDFTGLFVIILLIILKKVSKQFLNT